MERHSNYENNALTEVSLALAMAFFSIMVLCIFALSQSHISQKKENFEVINKDKNPPKLKNIDNTLIYYFQNNYYDKQFKKVDLEKVVDNQNIILSVSPKISLENLFQIKSNIKNRNVKITQHDEEKIKKFLKQRRLR